MEQFVQEIVMKIHYLMLIWDVMKYIVRRCVAAIMNTIATYVVELIIQIYLLQDLCPLMQSLLPDGTQDTSVCKPVTSGEDMLSL